MWKLPFPANPVAGISPFPVPDQALQDISRSTFAKVPQGHWKMTTLVAGLRQDGITAPFVVDAR